MAIPTRIQSSSPTITRASLEALHELVGQDLVKVDRIILHKVQSEITLIPELASYIIASGGKRLRPALTLACARLCGYQGEKHINLAACVVFIHTATLLHDDVVDESALRRGSATANDVWGNKASVLVGDFLLSRAFQLMVADGSLEVLKILSDTSAIIAQGEVLQLMTAGNMKTTEQQYLEVITAKTATLFAAACELGAVVADVPAKQNNMRQFGMYLGIAFQLMDDALDYYANQGILGKTVGDDFRDGKITLPVIVAYEKGDKAQKIFWERALQEGQQVEKDFHRAMDYIASHGGIIQTTARAAQYCAKAREALAPWPSSPMKTALMETVDFCEQRVY